jgi:toxin HigB-1
MLSIDRRLSRAIVSTLKGDLHGFWSVAVSGNWRIIFRFENGDAYEVDLIDYH